MSNDLQVMGDQMPARAEQGISIEQAFHAAASKSLDKDSLEVMKQLLAMDAEKKFNSAFVELQQKLPIIQGYRGIPDKMGNIKFKYANFEDIDAAIRPLCLGMGFSYSFRETDYKDGKITTTMTLRHVAGHMIEVPCTTRIGSGPPGTSEQQVDAGAHTYGKRGALELGLGLRIVGARDDAKMEGDTTTSVTKAQSDELEHRIALMNFSPQQVASFLKFYGGDNCKKYSEIPAAKYDAADMFLRGKEKQGK